MNRYIWAVIGVVFFICGVIVSANHFLNTAYENGYTTAQAEMQTAALNITIAKQSEINAITTQGEQQLEQVKNDAAAANNAADSLRETIANLRKQRDSATARASKAETAADNLQSELLIQSDEMAGEFAIAADEARQRGLICERAYDAVRGVK